MSYTDAYTAYSQEKRISVIYSLISESGGAAFCSPWALFDVRLPLECSPQIKQEEPNDVATCCWSSAQTSRDAEKLLRVGKINCA